MWLAKLATVFVEFGYLTLPQVFTRHKKHFLVIVAVFNKFFAMKTTTIIYLALFLLACSGIPKNNYKDTRNLEFPPTLKANKNKAPKLPHQDQKKGLGDLVSWATNTERPVLLLNKTFPRAWIIVAKALATNNIDIIDQNRNEGVYFVNYDTTGYTSKFLDFFLFRGQHKKIHYKLTLLAKDAKIEIVATAEAPESSNILFANEDELEEFEVTATTLIKTLFKTMRDDLLNDF